MRDVALHYNPDMLVEMVDPENVPGTTPGTTPAEKTRNFAIALHRKLFIIEPSAVIRTLIFQGCDLDHPAVMPMLFIIF